MTNYTKLFYWLTIADNAKLFFGWFAVIGLIVAALFTLMYVIARQSDTWEDKTPEPKREAARKHIGMDMRYAWVIGIIFLALWVFTPNKKDALLIVAGGQTMQFLASDSSSKKIPAELTSFVLTEIKNMAKDAEVELNLNSQKEKILESAKNMTTVELLEKMQSDSIFAKVILDK